MTPPHWAQPHPYAQDFDEFWLVRQLPPAPWPELPPGPIDHQLYGPTGTKWLFPVSDYIDRLTTGGFSAGFQGIASQLLAEARHVAVPLATTWGWQTPADAPDQVALSGGHMRWIHAEVIGTIGSSEQVAHTFNFRTSPAVDVDQAPADLLLFAGQVGAAWTAFMHTSNPNAVSDSFSADLHYTEVRAAYLEQTPAATITTVPGKTRPKKHFAYPRPNYLVPTQYWQFPANAVRGTGDTKMPWEVALVASLTTGLRGPRNRGRVYLGPLSSDLMGNDGQFAPQAHAIGAALGTAFVNGINTSSGNRLHVVSRAYATSIGVNGVAIGLTPDSQRRRRKSQAEGSIPVWTG